MTPEAEALGSQSEADSSVVAAIDEVDGRSQLVIADITRDGVWLSMPEHHTVTLDAWR